MPWKLKLLQRYMWYTQVINYLNKLKYKQSTELMKTEHRMHTIPTR